ARGHRNRGHGHGNARNQTSLSRGYCGSKGNRVLVRRERSLKTHGEMNGKRGENPPLPRNCKRLYSLFQATASKGGKAQAIVNVSRVRRPVLPAFCQSPLFRGKRRTSCVCRNSTQAPPFCFWRSSQLLLFSRQGQGPQGPVRRARSGARLSIRSARLFQKRASLWFRAQKWLALQGWLRKATLFSLTLK